MLVFGDRTVVVDPRALAARLDAARAAGPGLARHAALAAALIEAGELAQAIADAGEDDGAALDLAIAIARALDRSWRSELADAGAIPRAALAGGARRARLPEGYAFYALYPEAYLAAAAASPRRPDLVIGIRSIGTSLGAAVVAATGAPALITVRPGGDPFRRTVALPAPPRPAGAIVAVADEGPGLSGSSFGAVVDALEGDGVPLDRIDLFPSHRGDLGPVADPRHRARWARARRHVVDFEGLIAPRLAGWFADALGPAEHPPVDLSGGAWRRRRDLDAPAHPQQERRKYLLRAGGHAWLLKFAGLGAHGEHAFARGRELAAAGFVPDVAALRHGFVAHRWHDDAAPPRFDRGDVVDAIGAYLALRADRFRAADDAGASDDELRMMARRNTALALGDDAAEALASRPAPPRPPRRIETDNRMHAWEWLALPGGRVLKTDAVDHHAAHDLIGCQDVAWDLVGAELELGLDAAALRRIAARVGGVDPARVEAMRPWYLAFQLGYWTLAGDAATAARYAERLGALLAT